MPRSVAEYLKHILDEVEYLDQAARGSSKSQFLEDETLKRSFVRSIEVIGEAIRKFQFRFEKSTRLFSGD